MWWIVVAINRGHMVIQPMSTQNRKKKMPLVVVYLRQCAGTIVWMIAFCRKAIERVPVGYTGSVDHYEKLSFLR